MQYRGEIAIAHVSDITNDPVLKIRSSILTGHLAGKDCYIAYNGNPCLLRGDILIRLDSPPPNTSLSLDERTATGRFIATTVPNHFEFAPSNEAILYGIWQQRMKRQHGEIPKIGRLSNVYNPGTMLLVLHYIYKDSRIIPYILSKGREPEVKRHEDTGHLQSPGSALRRYLLRIDKRENASCPRVVIIEEGRLVERILHEFSRIDMKQIQMEPQQ